MPHQHGFGDNGTNSAGPRQSGQDADQMDQENSEFAHPGNRINTKTIEFRSILTIRHGQPRNAWEIPTVRGYGKTFAIACSNLARLGDPATRAGTTPRSIMFKSTGL